MSERRNYSGILRPTELACEHYLNQHARQQIKIDVRMPRVKYPVGIDLELWIIAIKQNILGILVVRGLLTPDEISRIADYFETPKQKRTDHIEPLLDRLSIGIANYCS